MVNKADRYNKSLTSSTPGVTPGDKHKVKPKKVETVLQRIERLTHLYDDGPKPKHFDDKSIVDMEEWNKMNGLEKKTPVIMKPKINRPKPFK
mgnify:CR=1 FL=1